MDIEKMDLDKLCNGFNFLLKKKENIYKLHEMEITEYDREIILKSIELRNLINNNVRKLHTAEKFKRKDTYVGENKEKQIDLKAMISEYMFSKLLLEIYKKNRGLGYQINCPAVAEMVLNKEKQDVVIKKEGTHYFNVDVKSQFRNNKFPYLCVNIESFERMKTKGEFFIGAIIDGQLNDIATNNKITFYFISMDFFEKYSQKVLTSQYPNFTPYRKYPLENLN